MNTLDDLFTDAEQASIGQERLGSFLEIMEKLTESTTEQVKVDADLPEQLQALSNAVVGNARAFAELTSSINRVIDLARSVQPHAANVTNRPAVEGKGNTAPTPVAIAGPIPLPVVIAVAAIAPPGQQGQAPVNGSTNPIQNVADKAAAERYYREEVGHTAIAIAEQFKSVEALTWAYDKGRITAETGQTKQKEAATSASRSICDAVAQVRNSYTSLSAAALSFVASASPAATDTLSGSFQLLSAQLGRILMPIVLRVAYAFQEAADWLEKMGDEATESIGQFLVDAFDAGYDAVNQVVQAAKWAAGVMSDLGDSIRNAVGGEVFDAARDKIVSVLKVVGKYGAAFAIVSIVGGKAFGIISAAATAATGPVRILYAVVLAHPFVAVAAAIGLVVTAVLAMSGAFQAAGKDISDASSRISELEDTLDRLEEDREAKITIKDIEGPTGEGGIGAKWKGEFDMAGKDKKRQVEVANRMKAEARQLLGINTPKEENNQKEAIRKALIETSEGEDWGFDTWFRKRAIKKRLMEQGMPEGNAEHTANEVFSRADKAGVDLSNHQLGLDAINKALKAFGGERKQAEVQNAVADRILEQGGYDRSNRPKDDRYRGSGHIEPKEGITEAQIRAKYAHAIPHNGMNPGYQAIDQARKSLQVAALATDPLQVKMLDVQRKGFERLVKLTEQLIQKDISKAKNEGRFIDFD